MNNDSKDGECRATQEVKANKGAAGIDGMTIEAFPLWMQQGGWQRCKTQLELGEFYPSAVRRVEIDKPDGSKRKLERESGISTV